MSKVDGGPINPPYPSVPVDDFLFKTSRVNLLLTYRNVVEFSSFVEIEESKTSREHEETERDSPSPHFVICHGH